MFTNRLIKLLQILSRKEMTRFYEFSQSPYFCKHQDTRNLITYLNKIYPNFTAKNCHREQLFIKIFPKEPYQQAQLALVFTYSFRLLERFLVEEQFQEKKELSTVFLLQHLRKKNQYLHYDRILKGVEENLAKNPLQNSNFYHIKFIAASEADAYYTQLSHHKTDLRIQAKQDNLDYFYLSQKLRDACEMLVRSKILKVDYSTSLLEAVIAEVEQNSSKYASIPAITIYHQIYKMLSTDDPTYYADLIKNIQEHEAIFTKDELHGMYNYLQSFSVQEINRGNMDFLEAYFHIYQLQLEKELLIENGFLSEWYYKNIVTAGTRLGKNDWVYTFIETYREKLEPDKRENAYRFNLASYYYAIQNYDRVLELILTVEYKDSRYIQGVKALLLRTYYDLEEEESLYSLIDSFRQYIQRDKNISDARKKGFSNLLKFTKRTFALKMEKEFIVPEKFQTTYQKLKKDIEATAPIFNQTWLLSKVKELSNKE